MNKGFSPEEKATIIIEGLKKNVTIKELCEKYGVSKTQYYRWKKKFIEGGKKELKDQRKNSDNLKNRNHHLRELIYKLQILIGELKGKHIKGDINKLTKEHTKHEHTKKVTWEIIVGI